MAAFLAGERAVWGKKPRQRGCSVFAIKRKQVVRASPDKRIQVARLEPTRTSFQLLFACLLNKPLTLEKSYQKETQKMQWQIDIWRSMSSKKSRCDELQLSADYRFQWEETRTSPSWALFVLFKLSTCSFRAPRVGKSIIIQLEWLIFRWTVSFFVLCVFHNTVSGLVLSVFSPFYLSLGQ